MSVYSETINDLGFDPMAPGPEINQWEPWPMPSWTMREAWEKILGRTDLTVWTVENAQQLNQILASGVDRDEQ